MMFLSCENSNATNDEDVYDPFSEQDCLRDEDCPTGYYCDMITEKCAKESNLPDNGGLPEVILLKMMIQVVEHLQG